MLWAWKHWLPNLDQEHGKLVIPIALLLVWYHRKKLFAAGKISSNWGWLFLLGGVALVLLGMRAQQPRITLLALPVILFGIVLCIWGREMGRLLFLSHLFSGLHDSRGSVATSELSSAVLDHGSRAGVIFFSRHKAERRRHDTGPNCEQMGRGDSLRHCGGLQRLYQLSHIAIIMLTAIYVHVFEPTLWKNGRSHSPVRLVLRSLPTSDAY